MEKMLEFIDYYYYDLFFYYGIAIILLIVILGSIIIVQLFTIANMKKKVGNISNSEIVEVKRKKIEEEKSMGTKISDIDFLKNMTHSLIEKVESNQDYLQNCVVLSEIIYKNNQKVGFLQLNKNKNGVYVQALENGKLELVAIHNGRIDEIVDKEVEIQIQKKLQDIHFV